MTRKGYVGSCGGSCPICIAIVTALIAAQLRTLPVESRSEVLVKALKEAAYG